MPIEDLSIFASLPGLYDLAAKAKQSKTPSNVEQMSEDLEAQKTQVGQLVVCWKSAVKVMVYTNVQHDCL